ncbi:MAG: tRNA (cytidine(34)-2'-O)-methyltransferase [Hyphomicrobium sp.]
MRLALYQPDIPQNTGTILRLAACLDIPVDIIAPTGFDISDRSLKRAGLDYLNHVSLTKHESWDSFTQSCLKTRQSSCSKLILLSSKGLVRYTEHNFLKDDILLLGRESAGVPDHIHQTADAVIRIPIKKNLRSLNVAVAAAMVLGEALRQTDQYPKEIF